MSGSTRRLLLAVGLMAALALGAGCSGARIVDPVAVASHGPSIEAGLPVSGSASDDLAVLPSTSALPPPIVRRVGEAADEFVRTQDEYAPAGRETVPPAWSTPSPVTTASPYAAPAGSYPPPPPPPTTARTATPTYGTPTYRTPTTQARPVSAVPLSERCWSGCGLPCQDGISMWHARAVGGWAFYEGTDPAEDCGYWGFDLGRTHCGCWGYDLYYRYASGRFDRNDDARASKDGGYTHHIGAKLTMERAFGRSRFYWWAGAGGGYFITGDYLDDDDGFEIFGELGIGYVLSQNWRVRAGLNVHGMDTDVTRRNPVDDGSSRWLWVIAPVIELEFDF